MASSDISADQWSKFVEKVSRLEPKKQRAIASIFGAVVADAAGQALHWVYDLEKLKKIVEGLSEPEFLEPSQNPFYVVENGEQSTYGEQFLVQLDSLGECQGLSLDHAKEAFMGVYGPRAPGSFSYDPSMKQTGHRDLPIRGPWINGTMKTFVKAVVNNEKSTANETDDPDCIVRCVPVVAYYAGHPDMLSKAEDCINLMQEFDITVATALLACRIMEQFILNDDSSLPVEKVLEGVVQELENPKRVSPHPLDKALLTHTREVLATDRTMVNYLACKKFGIA